ncbi:hypothetical protein FB45DRAFT_919932 [Roridomyces roridus]|uniref:Uncharacterized protein n=1 Tax=Roridomyces roridus TaxID=1738132 RepID=A0AAD7BS58_9AGAR|nr:hypothetical protein FB45DRAFT_919932 [Roridomyces roridus]
MQLVALFCFVFALMLVSSAAPVPAPPKPANKEAATSPPKPVAASTSVPKATEGGHDVPAASTGTDVFAPLPPLPTHAPILGAVAQDFESNPKGGGKPSGCVIA